MSTSRPRSLAIAVVLVAALFGLGCRQDMHDQPRYEPLEANPFFENGMASRSPVEGTVARGHLREDTAFYSGKDELGTFIVSLPMASDKALLRRGHERYDIFCSPCHGRLGDGKGMVVQRGFKAPPSLHQDRLREQPVGYYVDAMTNGFGTMASYASQVRAEDRWAIAAYIKVLQFSQRAHLTDLPPSDQEAIRQLGQTPSDGGTAEEGAH